MKILVRIRMSSRGKLRGLLPPPTNLPPNPAAAPPTTWGPNSATAWGTNPAVASATAGGQNSAALAGLSALASPSAGASAGASCVALGEQGHLANLKKDMMESERALNQYLNDKSIRHLPFEQQTIIRLRERIKALEIQINTIEQNATTEYVTGVVTGVVTGAVKGLVSTAFTACKAGFSWLGRLTEYKYDPKEEEDIFKNTTYDNSMLLRLLNKAKVDDNIDLIRLVQSRIELGKDSRAAYLQFMAAHRLFHMYKGDSELIKLMNLKDLLETLFIFLATDELKNAKHAQLERFHGQSAEASQNVSSQYIVPSKFSRMSTGLKELIKKLINTNKSIIERDEELKGLIKMLRTTGGGKELVPASASANNGRVNFEALEDKVLEIKSRRDEELKALIDSLPEEKIIAQTEQSIQTAEENSEELAEKMQPVIESEIKTVMDEADLKLAVVGPSANAGGAAGMNVNRGLGAGTGLNLTKITFGGVSSGAVPSAANTTSVKGKRAAPNANVRNANNANANATKKPKSAGGANAPVTPSNAMMRERRRKSRKSNAHKQRKTRKGRKN